MAGWWDEQRRSTGEWQAKERVSYRARQVARWWASENPQSRCGKDEKTDDVQRSAREIGKVAEAS